MSFALEWKARAYEARKHYLDERKIFSGCKDCGVSGPAEILSFDHVRGEKEFNIGQRWDVSRTRVDAEIEKCEVVCHNCHALRTTKRLRQEETGMPPFEAFPKIPRLRREATVTEKIDGTNAVIWIDEDGEVWPGSKNRWLSPGKATDNFGFAAWAADNAAALLRLGPGVYHGEWWGAGIQRHYNIEDRRFSLFNTKRWEETVPPEDKLLLGAIGVGAVPVLAEGDFTDVLVDGALATLIERGSQAAPGFMDPEGVVVFHAASKQLFKRTIKGDEAPKEVKSA